MCSIGDDNFEGEDASKYLPAIDKLNLASVCIKCKLNTPCIVLRHKDAYCKECFLGAATHKFKSFLGKHRLIYPNEKVLISYKLGHECTALLHMIRCGLDLTTPKKLKFEPVIIYIESNYHLTIDKRRDILRAIDNQAKEFNIPLHFITLAAFFDSDEKICNNLNKKYDDVLLSDDDCKKLRELFIEKVNETQKIEMYKIIERKFLYKLAAFLRCKHVFTPELSSHVATQLMTSVCMGRGKYLRLDVGFCDNRNSDVNIIRPLRHFSSKEVAMYNYFNSLSPVNIQLPVAKNSVQSLLKGFVDTLQANFAATITTILKTGDKLTLDADIQNNAKCKLCEAPIENQTLGLTSSESTMFSKVISNRKCANVDADEGKAEESFATTLNAFSAIQSTDYCFACVQLQRNAMLEPLV